MATGYSANARRNLLAGVPPLAYQKGERKPFPPTVSRETALSAMDSLGINPEDLHAGVTLFDEGVPFATVHLPQRPWSFVRRTATIDPQGGFESIVSWRHRPDGVLDVEFGAKRLSSRGVARRRGPALAEDDVRLVTCDASVMALGITPGGFAENDALFMSVAVEADLARIAYRCADGPVGRGSIPVHWLDLVPVDAYVLEAFSYFTQTLKVTNDDTGHDELSTADLMCAATAIAYDVPLYTARPKAYARLKRVVNLIEYRPVV